MKTQRAKEIEKRMKAKWRGPDKEKTSRERKGEGKLKAKEEIQEIKRWRKKQMPGEFYDC